MTAQALYAMLGIMPGMANHPNRGRAPDAPGRNPSPEEIREARESAGLSQTAAAALIYCGLRGWQQWESGERRMHAAFWELWRLKVATIRERDRLNEASQQP